MDTPEMIRSERGVDHLAGFSIAVQADAGIIPSYVNMLTVRSPYRAFSRSGKGTSSI